MGLVYIYGYSFRLDINYKSTFDSFSSIKQSDLGNIADTFQQTFNCSLQSFIRDDTSGDYGNLLIALVGPEVAATN